MITELRVGQRFRGVVLRYEQLDTITSQGKKNLLRAWVESPSRCPQPWGYYPGLSLGPSLGRTIWYSRCWMFMGPVSWNPFQQNSIVGRPNLTLPSGGQSNQLWKTLQVDVRRGSCRQSSHCGLSSWRWETAGEVWLGRWVLGTEQVRSLIAEIRSMLSSADYVICPCLCRELIKNYQGCKDSEEVKRVQEDILQAIQAEALERRQFKSHP